MREVNKFLVTTFCIISVAISVSFIGSKIFTFANSSDTSVDPSDIFNSDLALVDNYYVRADHPTSQSAFLDYSVKSDSYNAKFNTNHPSIKTGDVVSIYSNTNHLVNDFVISLKGDLDGDGEISLNDVAKAYQFYKKRISIDRASEIAGDVTDTGSIGVGDIAKIYQYSKGVIGSLD